MYVSPQGLTITAGLTKRQTWVTNSLITAAGTQYAMHLPALILPAGWYLRVKCENFDSVAAGDNATALVAHVQEALA